jgi:dimethylargininase
VSPAINRCELTHLERTPIDLGRAAAQHASYEGALKALGCELHVLAAEPELADSVFVEDIAVIIDELAVITRPGAASRRAERPSVAEALTPYRTLAWIRSPGTLDGGDVMRVGRTVYVGQSGRTDRAGFDQLRDLVSPHGYDLREVAVQGCLHLKTAVTAVADDVLLVNPEWVDPAEFDSFDIIKVAPGESFAANALAVGEGIIYPTTFPRTAERLAERGFHLVPVDLSELAKAEGAVTCCSLIVDLAD